MTAFPIQWWLCKKPAMPRDRQVHSSCHQRQRNKRKSSFKASGTQAETTRCHVRAHTNNGQFTRITWAEDVRKSRLCTGSEFGQHRFPQHRTNVVINCQRFLDGRSLLRWHALNPWLDVVPSTKNTNRWRNQVGTPSGKELIVEHVIKKWSRCSMIFQDIDLRTIKYFSYYCKIF